ncbi:MAG: 4-hydroxy-tetrahydrodipicolinate synthase [Acetivibrionales bacterium]|jgi:4-hydroxy-tetrahydrodipicolinate synthase
MSKKLCGVYAVVVTPFNEDGSFNFEAAKKHLDWLIDNGIRGICLLGATGEYQSVSNSEHKQYIKEIVPYIRDRVSVIAGATRERTEDVIDLVNNMKECGVDAAMILPPFYCHPTQKEIYEHYKRINDVCDFPMVIYNNPGSAGVIIQQDTFTELFALKNVVSVKDSTADIRNQTGLLLNAPDHLTVLCGCDNLALESFACGSHGWIAVAANFAPRDCIALFDSIANKKDLKGGLEIYRRLLPSLNNLENYGKPQAIIKHVLKEYRGIPMGTVRRPRLDLSPEEEAFIREQMKIESIS